MKQLVTDKLMVHQAKWTVPPLRAALVIAALAGTGCEKSAPVHPSEPSAPAEPPAAAAPGAAQQPAGAALAVTPTTAPTAQALPQPATAAQAAAPAVAPLTEAEVKALLDKWLAAQNDSQPKVYETLYATRLTGIKRAGARVQQFDRARWMADRLPRFGKKQEVKAADVKISLTPALARLQFVQTYATGSFQDKGSKELLVVRENGQARIAREEMLDSTLLGAAELPAPFAPDAFGLAVGPNDAPWLQLGVAQAADAGGEPKLEARGSAWVAVRPLAPAAAAALQGWQGREVVGFGVKGEVCRGQVAALGVLNEVVPHFGSVQQWDGELSEGGKASDADIARELVGLGGDGVRAAQIKPAAGGSCQGALWFQPAGGKAAALQRSETASEALRAAMIASLLQQPAFKAIQKDYLANVDRPGPNGWWGWEDEPTVAIFSRNGKTWLTTHKRAGDFCGGFGAELGAIWEVLDNGPQPKLSLLAIGPEVGAVGAALDVDGDGQPEFVVPQLFGGVEVWRKVGPVWRAVDSHDVPYLDCPC